MAITAFVSPVSGIWPLGLFTIASVGTPVPLNFNVGPQTEKIGLGGSIPSNNVRSLKITVPSGGTGNVYLLRKVAGAVVTAAGTPNFVCGIAYPGGSEDFVVHGVGAIINIDDYVLDCDSAAATCFVSAIYG